MSSPARSSAVLAVLILTGSGVMGSAQSAGQAPPSPEAANSTTVRITGRVLDAVNAQPLPGVTVTAESTNEVAVTDVDGRYTLLVPRGAQTLTVTLEGFQPKAIEVDATGGRPIELTTPLAIGGFAEEVTVTADVLTAETSTAAAQLLERRRAPAITDNMGGDEMSQNADSNAASALQRVTGLSVVDNQFVFVRGLGERYSNTSLNGAIVPSTEPERRVVSLDMFPASLLDNVSVVKSYTPDRPAEFAGGLVEIVPTKLPLRPSLDFTMQLGASSNTFGETVFDHGGSGTDWLGHDDGLRNLPGLIPGRRVIRGGIFTPELGFSRAELERFGESFRNQWMPVREDGRANSQWSAAFGHRWGGFGVLASVNHNQRATSQDEIQNYFRLEDDAGLTPFSEYDYQSYDVKSSLSGLATAGYQFNPGNRISFQGLSTGSGRRETRTFEGFNADVGRNLRNTRLLFVEEMLQSGQLSGEHFFQGLSNSRLEWRTSLSRSSRDEPDLRETLYEELSGSFQLADESQSGFRMFNDLDEDSFDIGANWATVLTSWAGLPTQIKAGPYYSKRQRDFSSRRFRFIPTDVRGFDLTQGPEQLFAPSNIGPVFELREETRSTDFYRAEQEIVAGYGMIDLPLDARWRLVTGVRIEQFHQVVDTFDLFDTDADDERDVIRGEIDEVDIFPSVNLVYSVRPDQNLRLGFSQTVNRPEFRELAPFEFTDIVGGRAVVGNADLTRSLIQNYDVRWEWFPGAGEVLAASFFYKNFSDPIERFVEPTAQLRTSFQNADSARNIGLELEGRKRLNRMFLVGGNYTYVDSSISLTGFQTNVLTTLERPLAGTSPNLFNGFGEVRLGGLTGRLLVNFFDDRIIDVGSLGLPDIVEEGRTSVDAVAQYGWDRFNVRFSVDNLTSQSVRFLQGGRVQREFDMGVTWAIQFGVGIY